jgi:hypothetical protein
MRVFVVLGVFAIGMLAAGLGRSLAQTPTSRPERPNRSLFGATSPDMEPVLTLNASVGAGYDTNILTGQSGVSLADPNLARNSASFQDVMAGLVFGSSWGKFELGASAESSVSYYQALDNPLIVSHAAGVGISYQVARRTLLAANQSVSYQPYFSMGLFPGLYDLPLGQTEATNSSRATSVQNRLSTTSSVVLTHTLTRKLSLVFNYDHWQTKSPYNVWDFSSRTAAGHVLFGVGRGLGLRFGYGYNDAHYGAVGTLPAKDYTGQNYDGGLDFNRALSLSRRVTLTFSTGTSVIGYQNETHFEVVGHARLNREIGRTWNVAFAYTRNVQALDTLRDPVVADSFTLGAGGLINRRLQFQSSAGASLGAVGFDKTASGYRSLFGTAGLSMGLTRRLAVGFNYYYYRYHFGEGVVLPPGFSSDEDRQSIRAHLSVSLPLSERRRRADATR